MGIGKIMAEAVVELNPFGPEGIQRRARNKAFRKAWRKYKRGKKLTQAEEAIMSEQTQVVFSDGKTVPRSEPIIPVRTSTKVGVTGLAAGLPIIQGIQEIDFPWPWLENFTNSDLFVQIATIALAVVVSRFTKSPADPPTPL